MTSIDADRQLNYLWNIYNVNQSWIQFSDTKSGAIIAANGVVVSVAISNAPSITRLLNSSTLWFSTECRFIFWFLLIVGIISLLFSTAYAISCLTPILNVGEPNSIVFFAHIAKRTRTAENYREDFNRVFLNSAEVHQLADQVWANAKVAWKKYVRVTWAFRSFSVLLAVIIVTLFFSQFA